MIDCPSDSMIADRELQAGFLAPFRMTPEAKHGCSIGKGRRSRQKSNGIDALDSALMGNPFIPQLVERVA
jgi:hypothetical protein